MDVDDDIEISPESALAKLQREADKNNDIDVRPRFGSAATKMRSWRSADVQMGWTPFRTKLTDAIADDVFQSIGSAGPTKPKLNRWKAHQLRAAKGKRKPLLRSPGHADSDMGLFDQLPGELRNYIYRLAFVPEEQPVLVVGSDLVCGSGACVHKLASIAAPGIASTCRQIRNELMPIFCAENEFKFDAVIVRNRCAMNWVRSMNTYARMIKKVVLEVLVLTRTASGTDSLVQDVTLECPAGRSDGRFEVSFGPAIPKEKVEACGLRSLLERLNGEDSAGERGRASKLAFIVGSDELAEVVYQCRRAR